MSDPAPYKPVCFMVMPFGRKPVLPRPPGAPESIDFDALWHKALVPLITELGYEPVRADQDSGAAIILEMLERLYFSDLVVADMTIPNGNVYYEVGIRHASKPSHCLLISAAWATALFDVNQMRRLVYPLPEADGGRIGDDTAEAIRAALRGGAKALAEGRSPMWQHIPGFPDAAKVDPQRASAIRAQLDALAAFQARVRSVRLLDDAAARKAQALALRDACPAADAVSAAVALEVLTLLRDVGDWAATQAYADALPDSLRSLGVVQEQRSLAQSKAGDHRQAIAALEALVAAQGPSAERLGLIGGRHKKLAAEAEQAATQAQQAGDSATAAARRRAARQHLDQAIAAYEAGMQCDLNDYYPSCNLPRLYAQRGDEGDAARAVAAAHVALAACERAKARNAQDEWLNPTLLGMAFDAGDLPKARALAREVDRQGPAAWKLDTTLNDLTRAVALQPAGAVRDGLQAVLDGLRALLPPTAAAG